jgi:archaellum component FlaC
MRTRVVALITALALLVAVAPVALAQALTVYTDKPSYLPGDVLVVYGTAPAGSWVGISIINPVGKEVDFKMVQAGPDNTYRTTFNLPTQLPYGDWVAGTYTVKAWLGAVTATTTFTLAPGSRVLGRVVDTKGRPIEGAEVAIVETGAKTTTGADGSFVLYAAPGSYTIRVSKAGYRTVERSVTLVLGDNDVGTVTLTSYEEIVEALERRVSQLENQVAQLSQTLEQLVGKISADLDTVKNSLATLLTKVDSLSKAVADLSSKVDAAVAAISEKVDSVGRAVADLRTVVDGISKTLATVSSDVKAVSSKVDTVSGKVDTVSSKVDVLRTTVDAISGTLKTVAEKLSTVDTTLTSVMDTVNAVKSDVAGIKTDVADVKGVVRTDIPALKTDVAGLKSDVAGLKTDVAAVKSDVATVKSDVAALKDLPGKVDTTSAATYVAIVFALLAFIMATLSYITIRKSVAAPK